jgi:hypothetical protein
VIRAAYRALMRHYHPDTNPDPQAQDRVRAITAAFAVLRDPTRRAEYDALRSQGDLWRPEEIRMPPDGSPPPAMRGWALASAALALALVVAVWARPLPEPPGSRAAIAPRSPPAAATRPPPAVELEPESARLARIRSDSELRKLRIGPGPLPGPRRQSPNSRRPPAPNHHGEGSDAIRVRPVSSPSPPPPSPALPSSCRPAASCTR